jgi:hypothetical protein
MTPISNIHLDAALLKFNDTFFILFLLKKIDGFCFSFIGLYAAIRAGILPDHADSHACNGFGRTGLHDVHLKSRIMLTQKPKTFYQKAHGLLLKSLRAFA